MLNLEAIESADCRGEKTFIRPMRPDEAHTLYLWATDPDVAPFWGGKDRYKSLEEFLDDWKSHYFDGSRPQLGRCFAIEADGKPIGMIAINAVCKKHRSTDIDIVLKMARAAKKMMKK